MTNIVSKTQLVLYVPVTTDVAHLRVLRVFVTLLIIAAWPIRRQLFRGLFRTLGKIGIIFLGRKRLPELGGRTGWVFVQVI